MMQLVCNGVRLDIYEDAGIQFTHQNPLFAFDDLKCERTTQFKLPSTPTNDRVFGLARVPAYKGDGMRRRFAAELQLGVVVKSGFLYVTSYDGKDYEAVFVTGELIGLQKAKDAGKLRDFYVPIATTEWGQMYDADQCINDVWKGAKYLQENVLEPTKFPSMQIKSIIEGVCAKLGIQVTMPAGSEKYRLIPSKLEPYTKKGAMFHSLKAIPASPDYYVNELVDIFDAFEPIAFPIYDIYGEVQYYDDQELQEHGYCFYFDNFTTPIAYVRGWRAKMKCFVDRGIHPNLAVLRRTNGQFYNYQGTYEPNRGGVGLYNVAYINAFGHKSPSTDFDIDDRFFEVKVGDEFAFIDYNDIEILKSDPTAADDRQTFLVAQFAHNGVRYANGGQPEYTIPFELTAGHRDWRYGNKGEIVFDPYAEGDTIPLYPFMPDVTLIDLLKAIAYMEGKVLDYTDANGITFEDLDISAYPVIGVQTMIERKSIERTFSNYAQLNIVRFDSDESVLDYEKIESEYAINNVSIEEEKELGKIFASEGSSSFGEDSQVQTNEYVFMRNEYDEIKKDTLAIAASGEAYLLRVNLPTNANLQHLCDLSTMFNVNIRLTAYEYEQITEKTILLIDGTRYIWTERSWQSDVAQFTLARVQ